MCPKIYQRNKNITNNRKVFPKKNTFLNLTVCPFNFIYQCNITDQSIKLFQNMDSNTLYKIKAGMHKASGFLLV